MHSTLGKHSVALYEIYEDALHYSLVMERCSGSLSELMMCEAGRLEESVVTDYAGQLITALQQLQKIGILHR